MPDKNRILIFSTAYFPHVGGAEVAMRELTDRLPEYEFDLVCAKLESGLSTREKIGRVTVHRVGFGKSFDKYLLPFLGAVKGFALLRGERKPIVWSVLASYNGFAALFTTFLKPGTKLLLTLQEGDPLEHYAKRTGIFRGLHKAIFRRANSVQAISRFLADWAKDMGFAGEPEVIPNGVGLELFDVQTVPEIRKKIRDDMGFSDDDVVIVTASRLVKKNGIDILVRALERLPEAYTFLILGSGEDESMLKALVHELGLEGRVVFAGQQAYEDLPPFYQASDIFVRPSRSEGLGNSFLEAMAAGIPVVATPVGGIPDFLLDGQTGVFCEPENPESTAEAIQRIHGDSALRARIVEQARTLVRQKYAWTSVAGRFLDLLKEIERS